MEGKAYFGKSEDEDARMDHLEQSVVTDYDQLVRCLVDAQNQFFGLRKMLTSENEEQFAQRKEEGFLHLTEYLKTQNKTIDERFLNDSEVQILIKNYDAIIDGLRMSASVHDIAPILNNIDMLVSKSQDKLFNLITTKKHLWATFLDFKNQFVEIDLDFKQGKSIEEIKERNALRMYKTVEQLLADRHRSLAPAFQEQEKYKHWMLIFNDVAQRLSNFENESELRSALKEIEEHLNKID